MPKSYFNDAITGNSSLLGCYTGRGELIRLFWPNIDYPQHIDKFKAGLFFPEEGNGTSWLDSEDWTHKQSYVKDTNILLTEYTNSCRCLRVLQYDFALPDRDVLVRRYELENFGGCDFETGFMHFSSGLSEIQQYSGVLFDLGLDMLIHYKHDYYFSISSSLPVWKYQLGNALESAGNADLKGKDCIGMMQDGAVAWRLGKLGAGDKQNFTLYICFSHKLKEVKKLAAGIVQSDSGRLLEETSDYWRMLLKRVRRVNTGIEAVDRLYKRSVLVFSLMSDKRTGGLLAAPEADEEFTRCGRYAYCWGRDAAFITEALDKCGLNEESEKFYTWAAQVQDEEGSWQQRYNMDGNLAPSWGMQIDEAGSILWGILKHYKATGDKSFLASMWECIRKGVEFLIKYIDPETGLPWLSFDLWEERLGEHAYSSAAVRAGILAGAEAGEILGQPQAMLHRWREAADNIGSAIERSFWKQDRNRFIRSTRLKMNPWGEEYTGDRVWLKIDNKDNYRDFTLENDAADISLLGLCVPFGLCSADDPRMESTAEALEKQLNVNGSGGLLRYENDGYIGGNPWIISTLWASIYNTERGRFDSARAYFDWAVGSRTELDLLPEQINASDGRPAWIIPLTWSHAMFVLALFRLLDEGVLEDRPVPQDG